MSNRLYDPNVGRVLAADPVIADRMGQDGANRYSYVYNHPTAFIDPSGFDGGESGGDDEGSDGGPDLEWVASVDFGSLASPFGAVQVSFGLVDMSSDTSSPMTGEGSSTYLEGEEHAGPSSGGVGADAIYGDGFSSDSSQGTAKFDLTAVRYAQDPASSYGEKSNPSMGMGWLGLMLMAVLNPPAAIVAVAGTGVAEGAVLVEQNMPAIENAEAAIAEAGAAEISQLTADASGFGNQLSRLGSYVSDLASDAVNAARLANQLVREEAASAFTETGGLSAESISGAKQIFAPGTLGNPAIPEGFGKYTTQAFDSPSGPFQAHFYMNPESGAVFYGLDYKVIFSLGIQPFTPAIGIAP
jgi:hypothetical protein